MSPSQFWAIVMIVASVGVYFLLEFAFKKRAEELALASQNSDEEKITAKTEKVVEKQVEESNSIEEDLKEQSVLKDENNNEEI
jgi:hypothetical protein